MKNVFGVIMIVSFIQIGCNSNSGSGNDVDNNEVADSLSVTTNTKDTTVTKTATVVKDTLADLLNELKNTPINKEYKLKGELGTGILNFKSMELGDLLHLRFIDNEKKEYDFNGNITKIELYKEATSPSEDNQGYEVNKKYLNKKFRVVWRTLELKNKPKNETETNYYEVYDEIIYLKQLK